MPYQYCLVALLIFGSTEAHAYLDPGTGSILIQGLIAAVAGGLFTMRIYWQKVKNFFAPQVVKTDDENPVPPSD